MIEKNRGHIINIESKSGHEIYPRGVVYFSTKHVVMAVTESTEESVYGTKVRVSMMPAGPVETELNNILFSGNDDLVDFVLKGIQPLTADDIAEIKVFVANRPVHVNNLDSTVMPIAQSSAQMVYRYEN